MRAHSQASLRKREEKPLVVEVTHAPEPAAREHLVEVLRELLAKDGR